MGLTFRGNDNVPYFYRSYREGRRVRRAFLGRGPEALELARRDADRRAALRARRRAADATVADLRGVGRTISRLSDAVEASFINAMRCCGWYTHKRQWRKRGTAMHPGTKAFDDAFRAESARRLFDAADDVPALIDRLGGRLGKRVRERLVERLSDDPEVREALRREAEGLRRELEGEKPTVIERLVVERVIVAWLGVAWADILCDGFGGDFTMPEVGAHCARMRNAANRNYLASLKALALIRRAAPPVTVITKTVVLKKGGEERPNTGWLNVPPVVGRN